MSFNYKSLLPTPAQIKAEFPLTPECVELKAARDKEVADVITGKSKKFLVIIGPCSADREDAVCEYMSRLAKVNEQVKDKLVIVPRVYTNKPRTTGGGYKGMLHQPDPEKKPNMYEGLVAIRKLHMRVIEDYGFTTADEMLYPENYSYLSDVLSYVAIGARSVENQQHRLVSSGMDVPVGMKNPTSGDLGVMLNAVYAAQHGHDFIYRTWEVETKGNPLAHTILRGAVSKHGQCLPNYHYEDLELLYNPERVLMEWNGMWNLDALKLPNDWDLYQQITIIDGSTFDLYLQNMKPLIGAMVRNTEMIIMNRCDEIEDLDVYRRTLKGMNPQVQIVFEDAEGEIEEVTEADLPFDVNAEVIEIPPEAYGIWYIDAMDKPDRYRGKTVEFIGMVLKTPDFPKNNFVPGRMAMTCCEADMTFLGFMCKAKNARLLETKDWVKVRARVEYEYMPEYEGEGPMLYADYVEKAEPIEEIVQF